jgi:hypothetical protein
MLMMRKSLQRLHCSVIGMKTISQRKRRYVLGWLAISLFVANLIVITTTTESAQATEQVKVEKNPTLKTQNCLFFNFFCKSPFETKESVIRFIADERPIGSGVLVHRTSVMVDKCSFSHDQRTPRTCYEYDVLTAAHVAVLLFNNFFNGTFFDKVKINSEKVETGKVKKWEIGFHDGKSRSVDGIKAHQYPCISNASKLSFEKTILLLSKNQINNCSHGNDIAWLKITSSSLLPVAKLAPPKQKFSQGHYCTKGYPLADKNGSLNYKCGNTNFYAFNYLEKKRCFNGGYYFLKNLKVRVQMPLCYDMEISIGKIYRNVSGMSGGGLFSKRDELLLGVVMGVRHPHEEKEDYHYLYTSIDKVCASFSELCSKVGSRAPR